MALVNIKFMSETLGRSTDINVIIPQRSTEGEIGIKNNAGNEKFKTLLLLHGLSDDNTIWNRRTSIERYAIEHGIAVVLPSADRSFYTDMVYGDKYYTYISSEVLKIAREFLPLSDKREDNFVAGLSMGGYGALKIALKNPDKFEAAAGLSSVADIDLYMKKYGKEFCKCIFGREDCVPESEDLFFLSKETDKLSVKPRIYMGVGKQDFMYEENVRLKKHFENLNFDFLYRESEGTHDWSFWDEYIQYVLDWMIK